MNALSDLYDNQSPVTFVAQPKLRDILARGLLLGMLAAVMTAIFYKIEDLTYESYLRDLRLDATVQVIEARERIEEDIFEITLAMNEMVTLLGQNPDMGVTEFNIKAVDHVLAHPELRAIAAARNGEVGLVFPKFGNQDMMGTDYRDLGPLGDSAALSRDDGRADFIGPITLPDGARVLVLNKAVQTPGGPNQQTAWGGLSFILDHERFLERLSIPALEDRFDLLIQEVPAAKNAEGTVLYGDPAILQREPIDLAFNFPFGQWRFLATPDGGWPVHRPDFVSIWVERALLIMICMISLWYVMSLLDRRRMAEKLLSDGIEALDHGFVMFDSERRLVAFNNKYKQLAGGSGMVRIGARYEDIVKANLKEGLIPDAVGREEQWYAEWSKRLAIKEVDKEQILADGRLIRAYDRPLEDGSVVGLRIDITDLKKAQIAAEAANKAKTDFMGVLSHELRTPLTVILGHAQLAKNIKKMPVYMKLVKAVQEQPPEVAAELMPHCDALSAQIAKMMDALERSGNHLFTLISEILDFAKIDSGTLSMDMQRLSSTDIVSPIVEQMRPMVEEKGLYLKVEQTRSDLIADSQRIQQIMINLIGNATKFTDTGGITVKVSETEDHVVFDVTDTGIGIPQDHVTRVFEAFHQVDSSSGRKYGGTGLGLAISSDIARAHGGDLGATSEPGKGSTFTLRLPRPHTEASPKAPALDEDDEESLAAA